MVSSSTHALCSVLICPREREEKVEREKDPPAAESSGDPRLPSPLGADRIKAVGEAGERSARPLPLQLGELDLGRGCPHFDRTRTLGPLGAAVHDLGTQTWGVRGGKDGQGPRGLETARWGSPLPPTNLPSLAIL